MKRDVLDNTKYWVHREAQSKLNWLVDFDCFHIRESTSSYNLQKNWIQPTCPLSCASIRKDFQLRGDVTINIKIVN